MFIDLIFNKDLISGIGVVVIIGTTRLIWRAHKNKKDTNAIINFLKITSAKAPSGFRSTETIASNTNLTEARVEALCARHPKIRRNTEKKQSWILVA